MKTKFVKQMDNWSCYACVAAMITGETLQDVINFVGYNGSEIEEESEHPDKRKGFNISDINKYFADRKIVLGAMGANIAGFETNFHKEYAYMDVRIELNKPAMVLVKSPTLQNCDHCLYWDGKNLFDPYFGKVNLQDYAPVEWWPVVDFNKQ